MMLKRIILTQNRPLNNKLKYSSTNMDEIENAAEEEKPRLMVQIFLVICVVIMVMVFFLGM